MAEETVVERLISLIFRAKEAEDDYLSSLSEGERVAQGSYENWAPKDLIAHTNYWRKRTVESLAYHSREQKPPDYPDYEEMNRENFEQNKSLPLELHMRESRVVIKALDEVLRRFDDEDLTSPDRYSWRKGVPLISSVISNGFLHPITHLCQNYIKLGDQAAAFQLQEFAIKEVSEVDDSLASRNLAKYDLACFFAQTGNIEKAIEQLAEVFPNAPDLAEWSQKDPDLTVLQKDPRYLALIKA